jgi:hypothetical protein
VRTYSAAELKIFHCTRVKMPLTRLDPSMLIGFVCDEADVVFLFVLFSRFVSPAARSPSTCFPSSLTWSVLLPASSATRGLPSVLPRPTIFRCFDLPSPHMTCD